MSRTPLLAVAALVILSACSSSTSAAPSPSITAATSASSPSRSTATGGASGAIKPYGIASKECRAVSAAGKGASDVSTEALSGKVTQKTLDAAFTAPEIQDLPADARPLLVAFTAAATPLIGLSPDATMAKIGPLSEASGKISQALITICS